MLMAQVNKRIMGVALSVLAYPREVIQIRNDYAQYLYCVFNSLARQQTDEVGGGEW